MTKCNLPTASVPTCKRRKLEAHSGGGRYRATEACCCCGPPRRRSSAGADRRGGGGPGGMSAVWSVVSTVTTVRSTDSL